MNLFLTFIAFAAGEVDPSFSPILSKTNGAGINQIVVQPDGKILIAGSFRFANGTIRTGVARLNADGSFDSSFNPPEFRNDAGLTASIRAIGLHSDGRITVGGDFITAGNTSKNYLARLNSDGSLDNSFQPPVANYEDSQRAKGVYDLDVAPDNSIATVGNFTISVSISAAARFLVRLNANGSINPNFVNYYFGIVPFPSVAFQSTGKILFADTTMRRLNTDGSLDSSFQNPGFGRPVSSIIVQPDGKIIAVGEFQDTINSGIRRFDADGNIDPAFNPNGLGVSNGYVSNAALAPNGQIYIVGLFSSYNGTPVRSIARLNVDGTLDTTFTHNFTTAFSCVAVQADGKVIIPSNGLTRLNVDGSIDSTLQITISIGSYGLRVKLQPDGRILVGGNFDVANGQPRLYIARFNIDGTLDTNFNQTGAYSQSFFNEIFALDVQPDGKILAGGLLNIPGVRLNPNGSLDFTFPVSYVKDVKVLPDGRIVFVGLFKLFKIFNPDGTLSADYSARLSDNADLHKVLVEPNGKMWIVGRFSSYMGTPRGSIAKLNADGTLDSSFNPPGGANSHILDLALQSDGKAVIGGDFTSFNFNTNRKYIARVNPDGTLDTGFTTTVDYPLYAVKAEITGKILIGGDFLTVNGVSASRITRLNSNGTLDTAFNIGTGADGGVYNIDFQSDGKILLAGNFTQINGVPRFGIARLLNATVKTQFDFDGDGRADIAVFRPNGGFWYWLNSSNNTFSAMQFGQNGDRIAPADYDGDGKTDIAVWRANGASGSSDFYIWQSSTNSFRGEQFGLASDLPVSGDWDGDGKDDLAVYRGGASVGATGFFIYRPSANPAADFRIIYWGTNGDRPVRGDFDGDGKLDATVFRPSTNKWFVVKSSDGQYTETNFGTLTDQPVSGDFDGDGRTNLAVFRPSNGTWYTSTDPQTNYGAIQFGSNGDTPSAADYDGDGKADAAVFRPSNGSWYLLRTQSGFTGAQFGANGDIPIPSAYNY